MTYYYIFLLLKVLRTYNFEILSLYYTKVSCLYNKLSFQASLVYKTEIICTD